MSSVGRASGNFGVGHQNSSRAHLCPVVDLPTGPVSTPTGPCARCARFWSDHWKKQPAIHPLARPKTRCFCTFRNLSFDRSTTEDKPLHLTSFTGKKSSQSQGKGHCQLLPKDWKTAPPALTGDPLAPQQPPVAKGRHYAYAPKGAHL